MIAPAERLFLIREYYFSTKLRQIRQLQAQGREIVNLGIGNPDLPPPESAITVVQSLVEDKNSHGYQPYKGLNELRQAFAQWYDRLFRVRLDWETEVLPMMGSKQGIFYITMAFVNPGETVLVPDPGYPAYAAVARMLGAKAQTYNLLPQNGWLPDLDELESMDLRNVKLIWLNYPHMPTGVRANRELFSRLVQWAGEHNILLVNDNPYSFILCAEPLSLLSIPGAREVALELNSLSKSHNMAGWRIGVVLGHQEYIDAIVRVKSNVDSGMFLPLQHAAAKALQVGDSWYERINMIYQKRHSVGLKILEKLQCSAQQGQVGMFLWALIPQGFKDSYEFSDYVLSRYDIFITPGAIFGQNGHKYVRLSLAAGTTNLLTALKRIINHQHKKQIQYEH